MDLEPTLMYSASILSHGSDSESRRELQKQVSAYVSCLQTADLIIATNYQTSITVTVVFEEEENSMLWALLKSMGNHRADLTCQL